ncbi:MAG TPA: hypothetical protein VM120_25365 [Bryobacteraceae bacterium]|nr:hypothetical protein [Bryobacteraceae bacterium]
MGPGINFVVAMRQRYQTVSTAAQPLLQKPARDLTLEEAWVLIEYHVLSGQMKLIDGFGKGNEDRVRVDTLIAEVQFMQQNDRGHTTRWGTGTPAKAPSFYPTPQFAIVLYRLAVWLKTRWGASTIVWGGIGGARDTGNCHVGGHCVDFYGATTARGGVFDVARDWSSQPVYTKDGKLHPSEGNDPWGRDSKTYYRLLMTKDVEEREKTDSLYWNPRARDFFLDLFQFIAAECNSSGDSPPSDMRGGAQLKYGVTKYPDYPEVDGRGGRRSHWDHVHFQLGKAFY